MRFIEFEKVLNSENIFFSTQVDLKKKTWIHRGGIASYYVMPENIKAFAKVLNCIYSNKYPHLIVGCTSNIYILNSSNIPIVVSTVKCNQYTINAGILECDCGVQVSKLSKTMINQGIKGFEYLTMLPGTIGGAICNNSSVKNDSHSITSMLIDVDVLTPNGVQTIKKEDLNLDFRTSDFKKKIISGVILKARFKVVYGDIAEMQRIAEANEIERHRNLEGPSQNLGCTVHKLFCKGLMPLKYSLSMRLYSTILKLFVKDTIKRRKYRKNFLLKISGYSYLIPYVSDKQIITYVWKDNNADLLFNDYLRFMRDICRTDQVEIEIVK